MPQPPVSQTPVDQHPATPYAVPAAPVTAELEITRSRFIAALHPVTSRDEVHAALDGARAANPDASHHCYAYLLGSPQSGEAAMSDDGEPSGTAGRPIFTVLRHRDVGDVLIVVTRYFGGVKLGAGGLVRAYMASAQAVVAGMETVTQVPLTRMTLDGSFADEQPIRHLASVHGGRVLDVDYGQGAAVTVEVPTAAGAALHSFCAAHGIAIR